MNKGFLSMIDLSTNIQKGVRVLNGISAGVAAIMIVGLTLVCSGIFPLLWYFDIDSTLGYAVPLIEKLLPSLPSELAVVSGVVVLSITLLPTIVEIFLPSLGTQIKSIAFLVFGFIVGDALTDWPRVRTVMDVYRPKFDGYGLIGTVLWYPCHAGLLLFATILFEVIFAVCFVLIIALIAKIFAIEGRKPPKEIKGELAHEV